MVLGFHQSERKVHFDDLLLERSHWKITVTKNVVCEVGTIGMLKKMALFD